MRPDNEIVKIRKEQPGDIPAIHRLNELAFDHPVEAKIVDSLRAANAVILSLVATIGKEVVGHILFSPVTVESNAGTFKAVALAPMAVLPGRQKNGAGSMLVRARLDELRRSGHEVVFVLGHPEYYPQMGFEKASLHGLKWEFEAPDEAFMVIELRPGALQGRGGVVKYRPEFSVA